MLPTSGSYLLDVIPWKFLKCTSEIVRLLCMRCKLETRSGIALGKGSYGVLIAQSEILLPIALSHLDSVIDVVNGHCVICDVLHTSQATATLEVGGHG